jgi:hypothetical protein
MSTRPRQQRIGLPSSWHRAAEATRAAGQLAVCSAVDPLDSAILRRSSCANWESESSRAPMTTMRSPRRASLTRASPQALRSGRAGAFRPCRSISQIIFWLPMLRSTVPPKYTGSGITRTSCEPTGQRNLTSPPLIRFNPSPSIAVVVLAEKVIPAGRVISRTAGAALFAGGAWLLAQALR